MGMKNPDDQFLLCQHYDDLGRGIDRLYMEWKMILHPFLLIANKLGGLLC